MPGRNHKVSHLKRLPSFSKDTLIADIPHHDLTVLYRNNKINEARLELITLASDAAFWSFEPDTQVFWTNEKGRELFEFSPTAELTLQLMLDRIHPGDLQLLKEKIRETLEGDKKVSAECRIMLADGSIRRILSSGIFLSQGKQDYQSVIGVSVDITEKKKAEQSVARQVEFENLLADISASLAKLVPSTDVDQEIELALKKMLDYFGGDRCALIKVWPKGREPLITHAYYREGFGRVPAEMELASLFPWTFDKLIRQQDSVCFSSVEELPPEADIERRSWTDQGVISGLHIPLYRKDSSRFVILVHSLTSTITWHQETLPQLRLVGELLMNAIYLNNMEEDLRKSFFELQQLKDKLQLEADNVSADFRLPQSHEDIIGQSEPITRVLSMVEQVAPTAATVLICGETGTGKELIAQAVHNLSTRRNRLMIKVNCASLPSSLIESELFGREKGAYTGALTRQAGRFELADNSTIFLDEIGELPLELQSKLLRVLQDGEFERLGSNQTIKIDVRVIAATNRNLAEEVKKGNFREDLYYRLNVFPMIVPPLRDRLDDIPMLVWEFVKEFNAKMGKKIHKIPKPVMASLQAYSWPGNIRELRNVIEYGAIISPGDELRVRLPDTSMNGSSAKMTFEEMETRYIEDVLRHTGWRIKGDSGAARIIGLNPATLYSRMKKLGISSQRGKVDS